VAAVADFQAAVAASAAAAREGAGKMHHKEFIRQLDEEKIVAAIAEAETRTSGEIRVYVSHRKIDDALARAQRRFVKLGMTKTAERNAVLIYFAPRVRQFAIIGDTGVHEKCGDIFWTEVTAQLSADLKSGPATEALVAAIRKIGDLLAAHFPPSPGDKNELPNQIEHE
jgi:uncharacterized membrane protein